MYDFIINPNAAIFNHIIVWSYYANVWGHKPFSLLITIKTFWQKGNEWENSEVFLLFCTVYSVFIILPFPSPGVLPDPGIEPRSPHCRQILYHLSYQRIQNGKEYEKECVCVCIYIYIYIYIYMLNWITLLYSKNWGIPGGASGQEPNYQCRRR